MHKAVLSLIMAICLSFFFYSSSDAAEGIPLHPDNILDISPSPALDDVPEYIEVFEPPVEGMPEADHYYIADVPVAAVAGTFFITVYLTRDGVTSSFTTNNGTAGSGGTLTLGTTQTSGYSTVYANRMYVYFDNNSTQMLGDTDFTFDNLKVTGIQRATSAASSAGMNMGDLKVTNISIPEIGFSDSNPTLPVTVSASDYGDVGFSSWNCSFNRSTNSQNFANYYMLQFSFTQETSTKNAILSKLDGILGVLSGLADAISDGISKVLSTLFIPSDGFLIDHLQGFSDSVEEHLGFLGFPFVVASDLSLMVVNYSGAGSGVIKFDGLTLDLPGAEQSTIIPATDIDLGEWFTKFPAVSSALQFITTLLILVAVFNHSVHLLSKYFAIKAEIDIGGILSDPAMFDALVEDARDRDVAMSDAALSDRLKRKYGGL